MFLRSLPEVSLGLHLLLWQLKLFKCKFLRYPSMVINAWAVNLSLKGVCQSVCACRVSEMSLSEWSCHLTRKVVWWVVSPCHLQVVQRTGDLCFTGIFLTKFSLMFGRQVKKTDNFIYQRWLRGFLVTMREIQHLDSVTCFLRWKSWGDKKGKLRKLWSPHQQLKKFKYNVSSY